MSEDFTIDDYKKKLEHFCSYQERCHQEVINKLFDLKIKSSEHEHIIVHLIENNFLNEERFTNLFAVSKFHQKKWGKIRIKNELKARKISDYLITKALKGIPSDEYEMTFETLAEKHWETITEKNELKKRKKFCDYLLRKGWESELIFEKLDKFLRLQKK